MYRMRNVYIKNGFLVVANCMLEIAHLGPTLQVSLVCDEHVVLMHCRPQLDEKRVRNELIKKELGITLTFPTYREGLAAIHSGDKRPMEPL